MRWDYVYLGIAIVAEVVATSALKSAAGFTRMVPSIVVMLGYGIAFFFLSLTLDTIPVGIAYAIWSGVGVVLVSLLGWVLYQQALDTPALIGVALIVAGVIVINLYSNAVRH